MPTPVELENLMVRLTGDGSAYLNMLQSSQQKTIETMAAVEHAAHRIEGLVGSLQSFAGQALSTLSAAVGITGVFGTVMKSLNLAAEAESTEIAFEGLLKSAEKGIEMTRRLQEFAAETPMNLPDINQAAKTLLQYQVAGEKVIPLLRQLGDATGGNAEKFNRMTTAYGRMLSQGKFGGEVKESMIAAGFNPLTEIAKNTGKSLPQLSAMMEKGQITIKMVEDAFRSATSEGGAFFERMKKDSKSLEGLFSTMQDDVGGFLRVLGRDIVEIFKLKEAIQEISKLAQSAMKWLKSVPPETKKVVAVITAVGLGLGLLLTLWPMLVAVVSPVLSALAAGLSFLMGPLGLLILTIAGLAMKWIHDMGGIEKAMEKVKQKVIEVWDTTLGWLVESVERNKSLVVAIAALASVVITAVEAFRLLVFVGELADAVIVGMKLDILAMNAVMVLWKAAWFAVGAAVGFVKLLFVVFMGVFTAVKAMLLAGTTASIAYAAATWLINTAVAAYNTIVGLSALATSGWGVAMFIAVAAQGAATVATWLLNAALAAMNILLSPVVLVTIAAAVVAFAAALTLAWLVLVPLGSALYAAYEAGKSLVEVLMGMDGTMGPIAHLNAMFKEWYEMLKLIFIAVKQDLPAAWMLAQAAFKVMIANLTDLWQPLWTYVKQGWVALSELIADQFSLSFMQAMGNAAAETAKLFDVFGFKTAEIDAAVAAMNKSVDEAKKGAEQTAKMRLELMNKNFKVEEGEGAKRAREAFDQLAQDMEFAGLGQPIVNRVADVRDQIVDLGNETTNKYNQIMKHGFQKIDAAAFGGAEALGRIAEFQERLKRGITPGQLGAKVEAVKKEGADAKGKEEKMIELLELIRIEAKKANEKPVQPIIPAGL